MPEIKKAERETTTRGETKKIRQMRSPALKLSGRSVTNLITLGRVIAESMTGNAHFPSPPVTMDALKAALDELEEIHLRVLETRSTTALAEQREKKTEVTGMLRNLGAYVSGIALGNELIIRSAGMPVSKVRERHPAPAQVQNFIADFTGIPQSILLRWRRPQYASQFRVYMTLTPEVESSWEVIDTVSGRRKLVQNLASGKRYYFKVVAINAAGVSPDSEIAEAIAS
jgi:hypothetical protein